MRLPGAGDADRENEVVLPDRLDVGSLIRRLRADALSANGRRDDVAEVRRRDNGRFLRVADEALELGLPQRFLAAREGPHGADQIADARDRTGITADTQLCPARDDLHAELALEPVDVGLVVAGHEHHLVRVRDQDGDLRGVLHDARSFSNALTTPETIFPSARPFVSAITFGMTILVSCGPFAPVSAITRAAISRTRDSSSCSGR